MHSGIYGTVKDLSGNLLAGARVNITDGRKVVKSAVHGDYWRLLNPGTYKVEVSLPGAPGKVSRSVKVGSEPTRVDFVLELDDGTLYMQKDNDASPSGPGVIAVVLLAVAGLLLVVIVVMILYYRKVRKDYEYSKMEFT